MVVDLPRATLREKYVSFWQLTSANSVMAWGGIMCTTPNSLLGFDVAWPWTRFITAGATTVSSYVQLSCFGQRILFSYTHLLTWALRYFIPLLCQWSLALRGDYGIYVSFRIDYPTVSYSMHMIQLCVLVLAAFCYNIRSFWDKGWDKH